MGEVSTDKPAIGQMVHYYDGQTFAALVVKVCENKRVNVVVFEEDGRTLVFKNVAFSESKQDRCWGWVTT